MKNFKSKFELPSAIVSFKVSVIIPSSYDEVVYVAPKVENNKPNFYIKEDWSHGVMFDYWGGEPTPRYYKMSFTKDDKLVPAICYDSYSEMVLVAESYLYNVEQTNIEDVNIILNGKLLSTEEFKNGGKK